MPCPLLFWRLKQHVWTLSLWHARNVAFGLQVKHLRLLWGLLTVWGLIHCRMFLACWSLHNISIATMSNCFHSCYLCHRRHRGARPMKTQMVNCVRWHLVDNSPIFAQNACAEVLYLSPTDSRSNSEENLLSSVSNSALLTKKHAKGRIKEAKDDGVRISVFWIYPSARRQKTMKKK